MSLRFILGGSGSGKSRTMYEMIIKRSMERPGDRLMLIVPEQYTMQAQRHIVDLHPRHAVMNVDILSFERLAYRIFDELGESQKEILEDTGKNMIIRRLLAEHEEELYAFRGSIRKPGFVEQVKSMISELLQYGIGPEMLKEKSAELGASSMLYMKLQDICVIYEAFLKAIHERYLTTEEVPDRLCAVIDRSEQIRNSVLFFDDFTGFTPVQYRLMAEILSLAPEVYVSLSVDLCAKPFETAKMEELFFLPKDTIHQLENICREEGIARGRDILMKADHPSRFDGSRQLAALEAGLFRTAAKPYDGPDGDVEAWLLADPASEMRYVAMRIHEYVRQGGHRYSEIAVVTSDMSRYRGSAEYWFARYEIPCFFDGRRDVSGNMLVEWMRSLLNIFIQGFSYESVFRYLRCGLSGISAEDADGLENYVLAMGVRGFSRWQKVWTARPEGMDTEELDALNAVRVKLMQPMEVLYETAGSKNIRVIDLIRAVYLFMQQISIRQQLDEWQQRFEAAGDLARAREYAQIYDVVIELLERVNLILGQEKMSVREFLDVLEAGLSDLRVGIIPPGIDQVTFGDIRRTRIDNIRILFFVGMNDGLVPLVGSGNGLITDPERQKLAEHAVKLAPTAKEDACTEQFYLYLSLTKPSTRLVLTCSAQDAAGHELRMSSVLESIRQLFPELEVRRLLFNEGDMRYGDICAGYQFMIDGLREIRDYGRLPEGDWLAVYDWFHSDSQYKKQTETLVDAAFYRHWDEKLSQAAVRAVYHGHLTGGVTMLEKYAGCAYAHFIAYGLRLKERRIYQVQAPDIGMIFHQAIERFSLRIGHSGYEWRDIPDEKRDQLIEECVLSVAMEYNHAVMQDSKRAAYLTEKILKMAKRTVWALQQQLIKGDFDPVGYEVRFTTDLGTDSTHMTYGDNGEMALNGKIDRMDICEQDGQLFLKIIDYKSGNTAFDLSSVYYGLQMQLMVYMNAACESERQRRQNLLIVPAGVLYYHIDDPLILADSFEQFSGDEADMEILEKLAVDGLVVDDKEIILHMDRQPEQAPKVLPVSFKKDGTLTAYSSAALPENFEVLAWHVKQMTRQLGQSIFSGDISVNPYSYGQRKACDFCSFKGICGFDTGIAGYGYHRMKKMKKDQVWEAIMKEAGKWDLNGPKNSGRS